MLEILGEVALFTYKELTESEIEKLKKYLFNEKLGFDDISLSSIDINIIKYFTNISFKDNESLENITIKEQELKDNLSISDLEFNQFKYKLESNTFEYTQYVGGALCRLNYSFFWKTNYLHEVENGLNFLDLLIRFIKLIYIEILTLKDILIFLNYLKIMNILQMTI